jgi:peptidoglycan/LPS O-acetylase OafA/YrhL
MINGRLDSLDFLRGVAICGVVAFHVAGLFPADNVVLRAIAAQGFFGVQLFFVVSSLTMCLMWDRRSDESHRAAKFYIRRVCRIAPPFWLAMIFYCWFDFGQSQWAPDGLSLRHFATSAAFVHTFWPDTINSVVPGGWSIGVEMLFYLFFPLLICWRCRPELYLLGAFAMYVFNLVVVRPAYASLLDNYPHPGLISEFLYFQFFSQAPIFLCGMWLFKFLLASNDSYLRPAAIGVTWLALALFLKLGFGINSSPFFWLAMGGLLAGSYLAVSLQVSWLPVNRIGAISYSVYLTHFAVVWGLHRLFKSASIETQGNWTCLFAFFVTLSVCVLLGSLLAATVERWSAAAGKYLVSSLPGLSDLGAAVPERPIVKNPFG